jgi:hypothetical protein
MPKARSLRSIAPIDARLKCVQFALFRARNGFHGNEGVVGSSPTNGSRRTPLIGVLSFRGSSSSRSPRTTTGATWLRAGASDPCADADTLLDWAAARALSENCGFASVPARWRARAAARSDASTLRSHRGDDVVVGGLREARHLSRRALAEQELADLGGDDRLSRKHPWKTSTSVEKRS